MIADLRRGVGIWRRSRGRVTNGLTPVLLCGRYLIANALVFLVQPLWPKDCKVRPYYSRFGYSFLGINHASGPNKENSTELYGRSWERNESMDVRLGIPDWRTTFQDRVARRRVCDEAIRPGGAMCVQVWVSLARHNSASASKFVGR